MAKAKDSVFISYRRAINPYVARSVFMDLKLNDYDVFIDVEDVGSGSLDVILHQIDARSHFVLILVPGSFDRINNQGDWLRREIERAIDGKRNIVPVMAMKFQPADVAGQLKGKLSSLFDDHGGMNLHDDYFDDGMERLRTRYLKVAVSAPIKPTPAKERGAVAKLIEAASDPEVNTTGLREARFNWADSLSWLRPKLERRGTGLGTTLKWTFGQRAARYVLERSSDDSFTTAKEIYDGDLLEYSDPSWGGFHWSLSSTSPLYYRVKAKVALTGNDSLWSNVVKVDPIIDPIKPRFDFLPSGVLSFMKLAAPELEKPVVSSGVISWKWTPVRGAIGYVLEKSEFLSFYEPIFDGDDLEFDETVSKSEKLFKAPSRYRVKAKGALGNDSDWSKIVTV